MAIWRPTEDLHNALSAAEREINTARNALLLEFSAEEAGWKKSSPNRQAKEARVDDRLEAADAVLKAIQQARVVFG